MTPTRMNGARLIAEERDRQRRPSGVRGGEGYGKAHDSGHADELALAAATYALPATERHRHRRDPYGAPETWPWATRQWKPTPDDRIRELTKAGALIAAAIDSLQESGAAR